MGQPVLETSGAALLQVSDIEVIYDRTILAVSGVSLSVPKGGIVALLGANGAGKSTTLKAISGLVRAERAQVTRGSIHFQGRDSLAVDPSQRVRDGLVHVLEGRHVFGQLTVEDNLRSGGFVRGLSRRQMLEDLERLCLVSAAENQAQDPGRADFRWRTADGRHRSGLDDATDFSLARRAFHGTGAYYRSGDLRDRRSAQS